jgi:hypothetical protein
MDKRDKRTAKARRDRKIRRYMELAKLNSVYTVEVLEDSDIEKEEAKAED